jgi:hypothetical protein
MSETRPYIDDPEVTGDPDEGLPADTTVAVDDSLEARARRRVQELENEQTEIFEVPGWQDILGVELRLIGWEEGRKIGSRLRKVKPEAIRELYIMCDLILAATDGLHEILPHGGTKQSRHTWTSLAQAVLPPSELPDNLTPRRALLAIVNDKRIPALYAVWQNWSGGARAETIEEVVEDFGTTGSPR